MNKLIPLLFLLSACSFSTPDTSSTETKVPVSGMTLSYNRATLGHTDFEQYRLIDDQLFWECGRIVAGRYTPQQQQLAAVTEDQRAKINTVAQDLRHLVVDKGATFDKPGASTDFFDAGQLTLVMNYADGTPVTIKTSFDSVAIPNAWREHRVNELALALRDAAGGAPCGIKEFYHMAKKRFGDAP